VLQANQAFDTITYQKGESVIRMLEAYTGADAWRDGVRRYIRAHAYGNSVTDDLWREIDAVSPRKVTQIAHDFTLQAGVPLITADEACAGDRASGNVGLSQGRFSVDQASGGQWTIPVRLAGPGDARSQVVEPSGAQIRMNCPAIVNAGQTGYFRTLYRPQALNSLADQFARTDPYDQLGLINDSWALGETGYEPVADFLTLATRLPPDAHPIIWGELIGFIGDINGLYDGLPEQAAFRAWGRRLLEPVFQRVGWDPKPAEASNLSLLRGQLLTALGALDDPAVVAEAHRRFEAYVQQPDSLSPGTRRAVLTIVARHADPATWEQIHQLARRAPTPLEKTELYDLLGTSRDAGLARRTLELALSDEPDVTIGPNMIDAVSGPFPGLAFDFATTHIDRINRALEPDSRTQYVPGLVANSSDPAMIARLNDYAAERIPATARGSVVRAVSSIGFRAKVRAQTLPQISQWLAQHRG